MLVVALKLFKPFWPLDKEEPLFPFIYKYPKVAKPKLRFEESRLLHEYSSWELRDIVGRENSVSK